MEKDSLMDRVHLTINSIVRITLVIATIAAIYNENWLIAFVGAATFILTFLPELFEKGTKIDIPEEIEILAVLFIYATLFLGEANEYYLRFWWWDLFLHTGSAIGFGLIGFLILYTLYAKGKVNAKPLIIATFAFCFSLAIGALWEIFEFSMDQFFGTKMQKSGLVDTMWDLIVAAVGALFASTLGFIYMKNKKFFPLALIMKRFEKNNPKLFNKK